MSSPTRSVDVEGVLDRSRFELQHERAPGKRSQLHRLGQAVLAAGVADDLEAAHKLVWDTLTACGEHCPAWRALERAGIDPGSVGRHIDLINSDFRARERHAEFDKRRRAHREVDALRKATA